MPASVLHPSERTCRVLIINYSTKEQKNTVSTIQYSIVSSGEDEFVTVFVPGAEKPLVASKSGNPQFESIIAELRSGQADPSIVDKFTLSKAVAERFESLTDRV